MAASVTIVPANPNNDTSLLWDTSTLAINGTLAVKSAGRDVHESDGHHELQPERGEHRGDGDERTGRSCAYYLLESTNVALPLSQWKVVATNVLSANGNFTFIGTNVVTAGGAQQFYLLSNTNSNH